VQGRHSESGDGPIPIFVADVLHFLYKYNMPATTRKFKGPSGKYVTIYLDKALYRQFSREASARKLTVGKVIKERLLEREKARLSIYDRVKHLIGSVDGPPDLSTNPKYLHGFGEDLRPAGRK
jgi:hypothetical protein